MTFQGWFLIIAFVAILLLLCKPMGQWLFALYEGRRTPLHRVLGPVEAGSTACRGSTRPRSRDGGATRSIC
jgi:K+-transporting ATPase A subunit